MQKKILCICTLLITSLSAMEKEFKIPLELTHQSPEITRVHSQEYLQWLEKKTLNESLKLASDEYKFLKHDLTFVRAVLNATNDVIQAKKKSSLQPHYGISVIPDNYYGAGNALPREYADTYAIIPIAVAHALQSNVFKRILIINEFLNNDNYNDIKHYYSKGNGSLFYPDKNKDTELFNLFNGKIITSDKIKQNIDTFLETDGKNIDLIFYNLDIDEDTHNPKKYLSILNKYIPTVFILAGCPGAKEYDPQPAQVTIQQISTKALNQSKLPSCSFDVHYWSHTETEIVENLTIQAKS